MDSDQRIPGEEIITQKDIDDIQRQISVLAEALSLPEELIKFMAIKYGLQLMANNAVQHTPNFAEVHLPRFLGKAIE